MEEAFTTIQEAIYNMTPDEKAELLRNETRKRVVYIDEWEPDDNKNIYNGYID